MMEGAQKGIPKGAHTLKASAGVTATNIPTAQINPPKVKGQGSILVYFIYYETMGRELDALAL